MVRDYKKAKLVALGLKDLPKNSESGPAQLVNLPAISYSTEFTMQFFENTPEALDEQSIQKAMLMLHDGYEKDSEEARETINRFSDLLRSGNINEITHFMRKHPCAEWLSMIYLEEEDIEKLYELIGAQPPEVKAALNEIFAKQRKRLVNFGALLDRFIELTK